MDSRPRNLPSWMAIGNGSKLKEKDTICKKTKRKRVVRTVFYCMNEGELVEAALACLVGEHRVEDFLRDQKGRDAKVINGRIPTAEKQTKKKGRPVVKPAESTSDSDSQERTYVSETDVDINEMDTIPHSATSTTGTHRPEDQRAGLACSGPGAPGQEAGSTERHSETTSTTADDEALRLVREIFFS